MTDHGSPPPPQGWYQDPGDGRMLRWWDGTAWTEHTSPMPPPRPDPRPAVNEERSIARWVRSGVVVYAFTTVIAGALAFRMFTGVRTFVIEVMANPEAPLPVTADPFFGMTPGAAALFQLAYMVQLALWILFLIWVYRAATAGQHLGIPAARSPGWAVGSWFIPILNLWWPYESLRDMLPEGNAMRSRLLAVWVGWLAAGMISVAGLLMWIFGVEAGLWVGALGYLGSASAILAGRAFVDEVLHAHERLLSGGRIAG